MAIRFADGAVYNPIIPSKAPKFTHVRVSGSLVLSNLTSQVIQRKCLRHIIRGALLWGLCSGAALGPTTVWISIGVQRCGMPAMTAGLCLWRWFTAARLFSMVKPLFQEDTDSLTTLPGVLWY